MKPLRDLLVRAPSDPEDLVLFWHRAGNGEATVRAVLSDGPARLAGRPVRHAVECDLKWDLEDRAPLLFLHHGLTGLERVRARAARERRFFVLDHLLEHGVALDYLVEIKVGRGSRPAAVGALVEAMERRGLGQRFLVAASSLPVLEEVRYRHPKLLLGLFVAHVMRDGRVVHLPFVDVPRSLARAGVLGPSDLGSVDVVIGSGPLPCSSAASRRDLDSTRSSGLAWVPGPIRSRPALEALARGGVPSAFVYMSPSAE